MKRIFLTAVIMALGIGIAHAGALTEDYIDIASSYAKDGKYSQALGYINKALALEPQNSRLLEMKNDLSKIMGQPAINFPSQSSLTDINYIEAENARLAKDYNKAISYYKKGISENPQFAPNYLGLAITYYEMKNFQDAKYNLDYYLTKERNSDFALMLRAKTNLNLNNTQYALDDIRAANALNTNLEYKLTEGIILTEAGRYKEAREILNKVSQEIRTYLVFKYLGTCDYKLGDYKKAVLNFERAILLFEDDKTILPMYNDAKRRSNSPLSTLNAG